jgi:signal transduction histidine kinase
MAGSVSVMSYVWLRRGEFWKRAALPVSFLLLKIIADGVVYGLFGFTALWVSVLAKVAAYSFLGIFGVFVWKKINGKQLYPQMLLLLALPGLAFLMLYDGLYLRSLAFLYGGNFLLLAYAVIFEEKCAVYREKALIKAHRREVENRWDEFRKIRHDMNNQLATIEILIRSEQEESARDMIDTLAQEIINTNENPYCAIPVINAILTEKKHTCAMAGIDLYVELELPERLGVENIHLCSIFGNLLDNAIRASKEVKDVPRPAIELRSLADGDYLFIKSANPSNKPAKTRLPGRGYGTRILTDLAARYHGEYRGEYENGIFTASVLLLTAEGTA